MNTTFSTSHLRFLASLKQKKHRLQENRVVVEGKRILHQLADWGIYPLELYLSQEEPELEAGQIFRVSPQVMPRICESETPPSIAGLFKLPQPRKFAFRIAFYLDGISDPGNLGTIFRTASAFGVEGLILSSECCEVSSPKVIRSSLGAVYRVPFFYANPYEVFNLPAVLYCLDIDGQLKISEFQPDHPAIIALGSEAHGLSDSIKKLSKASIQIPMPGNMESLNAALSFGIAAYEMAKGQLNPK